MKVNRAKLLKQLRSVDVGVSKGELVEQSWCYAFRGGKVFTYNDEVACSCETNLPKDWEFAVSAKETKTLLGRLGGDEVEINFEGEELRVREGNRKKVGIRVETIEMPMDVVDDPLEWMEIPENLFKAIAVVRECTGSETPMMESVHFTPHYLEACDNVQAIRYMVDTGIEEPFLVKGSCLGALVGKEWGLTDSWLRFRGDGVNMSLRRYHGDDGKYLELDYILSVEGTEIEFPKGLVQAVERARVFVEGADTQTVRIRVKSGNVFLRGEGPGGWYEEKHPIEADDSAKPLEFFIGVNLVKDVAKRLEKKCIVGEDKLKIDSGEFVYVTCLGA